MSTPVSIAKALAAEFVIQFRAGMNDASPEQVADFISNEIRRGKKSAPRHFENSSVFTRDMPDSVGLWEFVCMENEELPERCAITKEKGHMIVHSEHLCETPLKHFHDGLTNIHWRKIA